jgi:hypothetical protein
MQCKHLHAHPHTSMQQKYSPPSLSMYPSLQYKHPLMAFLFTRNTTKILTLQSPKWRYCIDQNAQWTASRWRLGTYIWAKGDAAVISRVVRLWSRRRCRGDRSGSGREEGGKRRVDDMGGVRQLCVEELQSALRRAARWRNYNATWTCLMHF